MYIKIAIKKIKTKYNTKSMIILDMPLGKRRWKPEKSFYSLEGIM